MEAMVAVEPDVVNSLLGDKTWTEALKGGGPPPFAKAKVASNRWRNRWRLLEPWCWEWAVEQIQTYGAKARGAKFIITQVKLGPAPLPDEPFRFEAPPWQSRNEEWKHYKARVSRSFVEYRKAYRARVQSAAKQAGYVRTPELRNDDHFFWLARRHLHREKYVDMARHSVDLKPKQISVAVQRLARYIGFRLEVRSQLH
jgi:hypothetical protein